MPPPLVELRVCAVCGGEVRPLIEWDGPCPHCGARHITYEVRHRVLISGGGLAPFLVSETPNEAEPVEESLDPPDIACMMPSCDW